MLKAHLNYKRRFEGFRTDITHGPVLGISVNIPTKAFCPRMCFLFVYSESCFYTFGCIDWVGWRLARGDDGRDWPTRGLQEISHFSCKIFNEITKLSE